MIIERGFPKPSPLNDRRIVAEPTQHYVDVIAHGSGIMYSFAERVARRDRWAIAAYSRLAARPRRIGHRRSGRSAGGAAVRRPTRFGLVLILAIVASALVALIATRCTSVAARAWLTAYLFWTGLPIGALFLILTHGLTDGAAAALIRLNLLTPQGLLLDAESYNRTFTLW